MTLEHNGSAAVAIGSAAEAADPIIAVTNVSKTFGDTLALKNVTLSVNPGEVLALLGENGSGKSTLIKILSGYHLPDLGGSVTVAGRPLPLGAVGASHAAGLRFVHQHLALIKEFNAVENIAMDTGYTRPALIDWKAQGEVTRRLLDKLGVEMDIWCPLSKCRAVERSAVAIARALNTSSGDVAAVVLDEPTSSLPDPEVERLFGVIRELTGSGIAVVYVTHRLGEVFQIADRIAVLRDGEHQGTFLRSTLTRDDVIELIVGRAGDRHEAASRPSRHVSRGDTPVLHVEGLTAGGLRDVSFTVHSGEILGVVGLAGSGREDLTRALTGAIPIKAGQISLHGRPVARINPRRSRDLGVVLALSNTQPGSAIHQFRVRENITLGLLSRYLGRLRTFNRRRELSDSSRWVRSLDIRPADNDRSYGSLSGGNQQKVILARCLNTDPSLLLLDEPTAGVDVGARAALYRLLIERAAGGLGVIVSSSDIEDVISTCTRALVVRSGRVVAAFDGILSEKTLLAAAAHDVGSPVTDWTPTPS